MRLKDLLLSNNEVKKQATPEALERLYPGYIAFTKAEKELQEYMQETEKNLLEETPNWWTEESVDLLGDAIEVGME